MKKHHAQFPQKYRQIKFIKSLQQLLLFVRIYIMIYTPDCAEDDNDDTLIHDMYKVSAPMDAT